MKCLHVYPSASRCWCSIFAFTLLVAVFASSSMAQSGFRDWSNAPSVGLWQWGNSWNQNASPTDGNAAYFNNNAFLTSTNNSGIRWNIVSFEANANESRIVESGIALTDWDTGAKLGKIENKSSALHTVNGSVGLNGGNYVYEVNAISGDLTLNGAGVGGITNLTDNKSLFFYGNNSKTLTINDGVKGSGGVLALKASNNVVLNGISTYTGNTLIDAGSLTIGGSINSSSKVYLGSGILQQNAILGLTGTSEFANSLQVNTGGGSRTISKTDATAQTMSGLITNNNSTTISVSAAGGHLTISGAISRTEGTGAVTKSGDGKLTFSGANANTYTGLTTVSGGTLELNKTAGVNAIAGATTINSGAILLLSASDQVDSGAGDTVTLSGGTIQRGSGVSETFGALNLDSNSTLNFGSGTAGNLTFGTYEGGSTPTHKLTVNNFFAGNTLVFGSDLSSSIPVGTYSGTTYTSSDNLFTINSTSGGFTTSLSGSTFTITAIPEPSTYVAAAGLLAMFLWPVRRRLIKDAKSILGLRPTGRERIEAYRKA